MKSLALSVVVFGAALVASSASCSGPQAGISSFSGGDDDTTATSSSSTTSTSSSGAATTNDPIFGATAFAYNQPPENADDHNTGTHLNLPPMEGRACVVSGCHITGGAKPWAVAGTVYAAATGGAFTGQAEIGIVTPENKGFPVSTDAQGNFWLDGAANAAPPAGSKVGIRIAGGKTIQMQGALPAPPQSANCNDAGCHGLASNRIHVQ